MSSTITKEGIIQLGSGEGKLVDGDIPLGSYNPLNRAQRRVRCKDHPGGPFDRFVSIPGAGPLKWAEIEATGWVKPCASCAARETDPLPLTTGSTIYRSERDESGKMARASCGICGYDEHYVSLSLGANQTGFCTGCQPWALISLNAKHLAGPSPERVAIYAKIVRVRRLLEGNAAAERQGPTMPFWSLAKRFAERFPDANPVTRGAAQTSEVKHLLLFFEDKPIGGIGLGSVDEFTADFVKGSNRLGPRGAASARPLLELLRRMLGFATGKGWIEENPLPRGIRLGPPSSAYASDRLMTVDEEKRLHAECASDFGYLLPALLFVVDVPAHLRDFLRLRWTDVDFGSGCITIAAFNSKRHVKRQVEMTPRLHLQMLSLWERSDRSTKSSVISRSVDQCNYDFEKIRAAAGVKGLKWTDIRRTGAWRLERAGKDARQIASRLGMTLRNVDELLRVNHMVAEQEANSPHFLELLHEQFGTFVQLQNGNGQNNGGVGKGFKPRPKREPLKTVNGKSLEDLDASILKYYDEKGANSLVTLELIAHDVGLGRIGVGDGGQKNVSRLFKRNGVKDSFPIYRDKLITARRASVMP